MLCLRRTLARSSQSQRVSLSTSSSLLNTQTIDRHSFQDEADREPEAKTPRTEVNRNPPGTAASQMRFEERPNLFNAANKKPMLMYTQFMACPEVESMKNATLPNNWFGSEPSPFPTNPSFKPPIPVSDALKTQMYNEFMKDPVANDVRELSKRYHLSLKRIDAILRLKGQEAAWAKGNTLQTGFQAGIETLLGVNRQSDARIHERVETRDGIMKNLKQHRRDVNLSDALEQEENRDASRQRYQHQYWESVDEDGSKEPVVPGVLEASKRAAKLRIQKTEKTNAGTRFMPKIEETRNFVGRTPELQVATKPGRPAVMFVDVKGKFIKPAQVERRIITSERKAAKSVRLAEHKKSNR